MQYHGVIEKAEDWWIGWLVDLPGVNAQERTREELLESLESCAKDMLDLTGIHDPQVGIPILPDVDPGGAPREERQEVNVGV
ncbi:MAG: type II toxin-antitoxin system HicB family antitoxin [Pseudomonadota bacterium]